MLNYDLDHSVTMQSPVQHYVLNLEIAQQCLFGFLLESIDGLATHSKSSKADCLDVYVSTEQADDFLVFIQLWNEIVSAQYSYLPIGAAKTTRKVTNIIKGVL